MSIQQVFVSTDHYSPLNCFAITSCMMHQIKPRIYQNERRIDIAYIKNSKEDWKKVFMKIRKKKTIEKEKKKVKETK